MIPLSFTGDIRRLINLGGEDVTVLPNAGGSTTVRASVQTPFQAGLTGDANQEGFVVFISPIDLSSMPMEFYKILIRGLERSVVESHAIVANGINQAWQVRVIG